ncbi:uncharacterized protein BCR38DRAFT_510721 [Pseudomassariella vexata]|uniref:Fungal N-terminal domain-containing protein n=1 Tax=Pseudomassariella vexata TaxID=1141098 RepID=A0A1Y2E7Z7_9PEZI|nr:uncharacterized protein BCR38DRAFT_510721 [Pseudomassariella vexata]ORY67557.1 hypothetical protein BCR38DRAFT_510721 [Pseudomassariella vexata]
MDPATAIDLSCSILDLGNLALRRVKAFQKVHQSSQTQRQAERGMKECLNSMQVICDLVDSKELCIETQDRVSIQLREIAGDAISRIKAVSNTLQMLLEKCGVQRGRKLKSNARTWMRDMISKEEIEHYVINLERCIYDLSCIVALNTSHQLKKLSDQVGHSHVQSDIQTTHQELIEHIVKGNTTVSKATKLVRRGSAEARQMLHEHEVLQRRQSGRSDSGVKSKNVTQIALALGVGAIQFSDLIQNRSNLFRSWLEDGSGIFKVDSTDGSAISTAIRFLGQERDMREFIYRWAWTEQGRMVLGTCLFSIVSVLAIAVAVAVSISQDTSYIPVKEKIPL